MCASNETNSSFEMKPSIFARYTCLSITIGVFAVWHKFTFTPEEEGTPSIDFPVHSFKFPLAMTTLYLVSLPLLNKFVSTFLAPKYDMKSLLFESMVFYNVAQVCMNIWMVWRFLDAVMNRGHPFIGSIDYAAGGTTFAIWVHYTNKYLEFLDTYFMVLRGKMEQVSFLHVYHHTTIAWAWWVGISYFPAGDSYFGALLNSMIHVMMYSYYALALLKISCPWKRYLTQAQLAQFTSVVIYTMACVYLWGEKRNRQIIMCVLVQVGEMTSLFVLFARFYKKSYSKKSSKKDEDACSKAMGAISSSAKEGLRSAAKETNKFVKSANHVVSATSTSASKYI